MKNKGMTHRAKERMRREFPAGMYVGLMTSAIVTLVGVFLGLDPTVILVRAAVSAAVLGGLVSLGINIVKTSNMGYHPRHSKRS